MGKNNSKPYIENKIIKSNMLMQSNMSKTRHGRKFNANAKNEKTEVSKNTNIKKNNNKGKRNSVHVTLMQSNGTLNNMINNLENFQQNEDAKNSIVKKLSPIEPKNYAFNKHKNISESSCFGNSSKKINENKTNYLSKNYTYYNKCNNNLPCFSSPFKTNNINYLNTEANVNNNDFTSNDIKVNSNIKKMFTLNIFKNDNNISKNYSKAVNIPKNAKFHLIKSKIQKEQPIKFMSKKELPIITNDNIEKVPSKEETEKYKNINYKLMVSQIENENELVDKTNNSIVNQMNRHAKKSKSSKIKNNNEKLTIIAKDRKPTKSDNLLPTVNKSFALNLENSKQITNNKSLKESSFIKENSKIVVSKTSDKNVISIYTYQNLENFHLIKVIGRGTFGKVVLVQEKSKPNNYYAIKILKKDHLIETKNVKNIINEKKILLELNSNFIVNLIYSFKSEQKLFMVFDYHNGGELFFHLQKKKRFTEDEVKIYAAEIFCGLEYLHKRKIIYRDLKPENIILDKNGHIKLIDFGLAKKLKSNNDYSTSFCGTNEYIRKLIFCV